MEISEKIIFWDILSIYLIFGQFYIGKQSIFPAFQKNSTIIQQMLVWQISSHGWIILHIVLNIHNVFPSIKYRHTLDMLHVHDKNKSQLQTLTCSIYYHNDIN